ncbi:TetR/AcrR family transcriptional regulator [Nocardioides carbamazepini]|uniref:TetR/AcrR family transcriptional regulator n=1 Tax=Nocardioides carbamazepini TaxID=2854259 RepID=UPI00214A445E|nr:TetR/AcrR family transcriptional regulator [Nocardioides carbamazepini]MCR1781367.1 TetR/AcrR family transcriptional regulator [Nocardioides carbamazepini]
MNLDYEAKRRAVLDGAAEVFMRDGFAAGTTKDIAAEVGLSQPAIYHYVGSKSDLLREIALTVDHNMMEALEAGIRSSDTPAGQLRGIMREFTAAVVRDRRAFAVFWQELYSLEAETREKITKDERDFINRVARLVATLQKQNRMPPGPPTAVAQAIVSMPSWMYHWYRPGGPLDAESIADIYCSLIGINDA